MKFLIEPDWPSVIRRGTELTHAVALAAMSLHLPRVEHLLGGRPFVRVLKCDLFRPGQYFANQLLVSHFTVKQCTIHGSYIIYLT